MLASLSRRAMVAIGLLLLLCSALSPNHLAAQQTGAVSAGYDPKDCPSCASWNATHEPVRLFGNSYYVGTDGLSAVLITSAQGHILIDAGLPESAAPIMASIRALGFRVEDVKLILNSHAHYDHAGGIAAVQRASGARVAASVASAEVFRTGRATRSDPQFGVALPFPAISRVERFKDGDTLRVGALSVIAHATPGHTPGGTSWSWTSCEGARCVDVVYADSQSPISDDTFLYTKNSTYPNAIDDFRRGHARLEQLSCDLLVTPHPSASNLWKRIEARDAGGAPALIDRGACKRYAQTARDALAKRLATERATKP